MKFRETRALIRRLRGEISGMKVCEVKYDLPHSSPTVVLKAFEGEGERTTYQVYSRLVHDDGTAVNFSLDGGAAYPFTVNKEGLFWNYREPTSWLGKSDYVQRRLRRNSAEQLAYVDAKRFAGIIARGLGARVSEM